MAGWNELRTYIASNFAVGEDRGTSMTLVFQTSGTRSQVVVVSRTNNEGTGEEWVQISSPIGAVGEVPLENAARLVFGYLCGGIAIDGAFVCVMHSAPLVNLDVNEFRRPLDIVVAAADSIEQRLVGGDKY